MYSPCNHQKRTVFLIQWTGKEAEEENVLNLNKLRQNKIEAEKHV